MADWIDDSQEYQIRILQELIHHATRTPSAASAFLCEDCDAPIPEQRRKIIPGVQRCIDCQMMSELKNKNYRPA